MPFRRRLNILQHLAAQVAAAGPLFCEWGSGFGVVSCLAALLEFDAYDIEVDSTLVRASRRLAPELDLPAEFAQGSFIPAGATRPGPGVDLLDWTEALSSCKPKLLVAFGGEMSCRVPQR